MAKRPAKRLLNRAQQTLLADLDRVRLHQTLSEYPHLLQRLEEVFTDGSVNGLKMAVCAEFELERELLLLRARSIEWEILALPASFVALAGGPGGSGLQRATAFLQKAATETLSDEEKEDCAILSARLLMAQGQLQQAVDAFQRITIETPNATTPMRVSAVRAQCLACHGLAKELLLAQAADPNATPTPSAGGNGSDTASSSKLNGGAGAALTSASAAAMTADQTQAVMERYRKSAAISQERLFSATQTITYESLAPSTVIDCEYALQRLAVMAIQYGDIEQGLQHLRTILRLNVSDALRAHAAALHGRCLFRLCCTGSYRPPSDPSVTDNGKGIRPPRTVFSPSSLFEEATLISQIECALSVADTTFVPTPTQPDIPACPIKLRNVSTAHDALGSLLAYLGQEQSLIQVCEQGLASTGGDLNVWMLYCRALAATGRHEWAVNAYKQLAKLCSTNPEPLIMAARICLLHLGKTKEALEFTDAAMRIPSHAMHSQVLHMQGLACMNMFLTTTGDARAKWLRKALTSFDSASRSDVQSPYLAYHTALLHAHTRQIDLALHHAKRALSYECEHLKSLHLLALLLSSKRRYSDAMLICEAALEAHPHYVPVVLTTARLAELIGGGEMALSAFNVFLSDFGGSIAADTSNDLRQLVHVPAEYDAMGDKAVSRIASEQDSDMLSGDTRSVITTRSTRLEMTGSVPKYGEEEPSLRTEFWTGVGRLFRKLGRHEEAEKCLEEAMRSNLLSVVVEYQHGRTCESQGNLEEAAMHFERALAINPMHAGCLTHLGSVLFKQKRLAPAESHLRTAVEVDPLAHEAWHVLGLVLRERGALEKAAECFLAAVQHETTAPIQSFHTLPM